MEDSAIVDLYWKRDEAAISESKIKYDRYLMTIAANFLALREDQEECVSDTYLGAWNAIPPHRPARLSTFLGKMTRELSIDVLRKKDSAKRVPDACRVALDELAELVPGGHEPDAQLSAGELSRFIGDFLRRQREEVRVLFIGRYFYCDSMETLTRYYDMPAATVRSILSRARRQLAAELRREGYAI